MTRLVKLMKLGLLNIGCIELAKMNTLIYHIKINIDFDNALTSR